MTPVENPPQRVLLIHHRYRIRGGEDQAFDREAALLRRGGHEVETLDRHSSEMRGPMAQVNAARELPYSPAARDEVAARIESFRPDIVHVHNFFPTFTPSIYDACQSAGVPVVQTLHNFRIFCASGLLARNGQPCELCLGGNTFPALRYGCWQGSRFGTLAITRMIRKHRAEDTWNRKVNAFIVLSKFSAKKLAQGGLAPEKIQVKPNFAFEPPDDNHGAPEDYALFVGRLSEEKGVRTLLRAWERLSIPLWIVGDGPLRPEAEALKLKNPAIRVLGEMPPNSTARIMAKAKFLVAPSECYENFPLVVAEAYSFGLPVIASRIGALAEIVRHEGNGLLFEPGNAENLAALATKLVGNPAITAMLGNEARATYRELYTPEANLRRLREIYATAVADAGKR